MKFLGKFLLLAACVAAAQSPQTGPQPATAALPSGADVTQLASIVKQQFGETFTIPAKFPTPVITADFDGDGVEDRRDCRQQQRSSAGFVCIQYEVADPYHAYFGFGNPKFTSTFRADLNIAITCW